MANSDKSPAIYLFHNKANGKEYVGATHDIGKRMKRYISDYAKVTREKDRLNPEDVSSNTELIRDMIKYGWDGFEFTILEMGGELFDPMIRSIREVEECVRRRTILPEFGYNSTIGGESGSAKHRSFSDGRIRALMVYDTVDDSMWWSITGAKTIASELGVKVNIIPDAASRGSMVKNRYYVFYANKDQRDYAYKGFIMRRDVVKMNGSNDNDSQERTEKYKKAYITISEYADKLGFK